MKRFATSLLLTGALALGAASAVSADPIGDSAGPACTDIVIGAVSYNFSSPPTNTVTAAIGYNAPTCKDVQYTLVVDFLVGGKLKEKTQTIKGTGDTTPATVCDINGNCFTVYPLSFQINNIPVTDDGNVYVYTYTSSGSKLYDRGPGSGAVAVCQDCSGGGGGGSI
jgi:hypothetical protein